MPDKHVLPAEHACPSTLRQAPLPFCVPVGQRHVLFAASQEEPDGDWHEHDDDPCGAVEPATHFVHGGPPPGPYALGLHSHNCAGAKLDASAKELQDEVHAPFCGEEHSLLTQSAPVLQLRPLTLRHTPFDATKPWPGGHAQALAAWSHPLVEAGQEHELAPTEIVVEPPPQATHGDLPELL